MWKRCQNEGTLSVKKVGKMCLKFWLVIKIKIYADYFLPTKFCTDFFITE